jgi:hypothetical protein
MLYEMVAGDVPFRGESAWETVLMHVERQPAPPSTKSPQKIPEAYDAVVLKALEKDPNKRFRNASEMAAALREVLAAGPPLTPEEERAVRSGSGPSEEERAVRSGSGPPAEPAGDVLAPTESAELDTTKRPQKPEQPLAAEPSAAPPPEIPQVAVAPTQPQIHAPAPAEPRPEPVARGGSTVAFKQVSPTTESNSPSETPREVERHYPAPIPPLRWRARLYVGYLLVGSLLATCTISTALALTLDPSYLEHLAERNHIKVLGRLTDDDERPMPPKHKPAPTPTPAPEPESPFDRLLRAPADPPPAPAAAASINNKKVAARPASARPRPSGDDALIEVPTRGPSMAAIARKAATVIKENCLITPFSPLTEANYEVVFTVDVATGTIQKVAAVGEAPPLRAPDCVRSNAMRLVDKFTGARDLKAEYRHTYTVVR